MCKDKRKYYKKGSQLLSKGKKRSKSMPPKKQYTDTGYTTHSLIKCILHRHSCCQSAPLPCPEAPHIYKKGLTVITTTSLQIREL